MAAEVNRSSIYPPNVCMLMVPARSDSRLGKEAELYSQSFSFFFQFSSSSSSSFFFFFFWLSPLPMEGPGPGIVPMPQ